MDKPDLLFYAISAAEEPDDEESADAVREAVREGVGGAEKERLALLMDRQAAQEKQAASERRSSARRSAAEKASASDRTIFFKQKIRQVQWEISFKRHICSRCANVKTSHDYSALRCVLTCKRRSQSSSAPATP